MEQELLTTSFTVRTTSLLLLHRESINLVGSDLQRLSKSNVLLKADALIADCWEPCLAHIWTPLRMEIWQSFLASILELKHIIHICLLPLVLPLSNSDKSPSLSSWHLSIRQMQMTVLSPPCHLFFGLNKPSSQFYTAYPVLQCSSLWKHSTALLLHIFVLGNLKLYAMSRCDFVSTDKRWKIIFPDWLPESWWGQPRSVWTFWT